MNGPRTPARILLVVALLAASAAIADLELPPSTNPNADAEVAMEAIRSGNWEGAIIGFTAALKAEPDNASFHNALGYAYRKAGKLEPSFRHYRIALRIDPKLKSAHEYIGEAYVAVGDKAKAREHLAALEKLCGRDCEEYRDLAKAIADAK